MTKEGTAPTAVLTTGRPMASASSTTHPTLSPAGRRVGCARVWGRGAAAVLRHGPGAGPARERAGKKRTLAATDYPWKTGRLRVCQLGRRDTARMHGRSRQAPGRLPDGPDAGAAHTGWRARRAGRARRASEEPCSLARAPALAAGAGSSSSARGSPTELPAVTRDKRLQETNGYKRQTVTRDKRLQETNGYKR